MSTTLHVQFVVSTEDGRNISFNGDVSLVGLREWFDRAALGITTIFEPVGPVNVKCVSLGPNSQKIQAIKTTRYITRTSLKDAKDFIEGNLIIKTRSAIEAQQLIDELRQYGYDIESCSSSL